MSDAADTRDEEDLAFEAGHASVAGLPQPEVKPADFPGGVDHKEPEPEGSAAPRLPDGSQTTPEAPQLTIEERLAAIENNQHSLQQGQNSLAGRLGGINRDLQSLKTLRASQPQGSPAVAAAEKIVAERLKRLNADYPEVAAALADDLNEIFPHAPQGTAAPQGFDVEAIRQEAQQGAIVHLERKLLEREHPQWERDIALKDELGRPLRDPSGKYIPSRVFVEWLQSKPENYRQMFIGAVDSDFLGSGLTEFKEYRAKRMGVSPASPGRQASPAAAAPAPASNKQARLAAAITPSSNRAAASSGSTTLTEDDAFISGFNSVRGG